MARVIGSIRSLDALGRVIIPSEVRHAMNWVEGDKINFLMNDKTVVMEKYNPEVEKEKMKVVEGLKIVIDGLNDTEKAIVKRAIKYMDKY